MTNDRKGFVLGIACIIALLSVIMVLMPNPTKEQQKAWRLANKKRVAAYIKEWRSKNKQHVSEYQKVYQASEKSREYQHRHGKEYYERSIKPSEEKKAKRAAYSAAYDRLHPDKVLARQSRYKESHRAELAEKANQQYQVKSDEERKELYAKRRKYLKEYREQNRERLNEYSREQWAQGDPVKQKEYRRKRYEENRAEYIARAEDRQRQLRKRGEYTQADVDNLYLSQAGKCGGCKKPIENTRSRSVKGGYEVDHVLPVSLGGANTADNLQLLCVRCNRTKHDMHPDEWAARLGRLFV